ncbi:MAG: NfeD family protein [Rhodanobacter sp.]
MLMDTDVLGYSVNLGVIAGIALGAAAVLALVVWLVFRSRRAPQVAGDAAMLADTGELLEPVGAGGEAWVMVRGERWRVRCDTVLPAGARVCVVRRQGLLLWVEPVQADAAGS